MFRKLYIKLAFQNLIKNKNVYLPYLLACTFLMGVFYLFASFSFSTDVANNIPFGEYIKVFMSIGLLLVPFIYIPFSLYINSFLIKRRSMEMSLYGVLGLEKRHIAILLFWEKLFLYIANGIMGILFGMVFSQCAVWVLLKFIGSKVDILYAPSLAGSIASLVFFAALYIICFVYDMTKALTSKPIELMQGRKKGEKYSKFRLLLAILGFAMICLGYYLSAGSKVDQNIFFVFFAAVALVICGTYAVFSAGSEYIFKGLKENKQLYYTPENFINISCMSHRMKKNAIGLANICLFSTMTMFMLTLSNIVIFGREYVMGLAGKDLDFAIGLNVKALTEEEICLEFSTLAFLGILYGMVFVICTVLIMYYKQLTEGYEDYKRFEIMKKVGMDEKMIKSCITKQIEMVFLIPLLVCGLHMIFAFPMIRVFVNMLQITDLFMALVPLGITFLVFAMIYILAYLFTARTYYKLVR